MSVLKQLKIALCISGLIFAALAAQLSLSAPAVLHTNPAHSDLQQELMRLRSEGAAHFENGIEIKKALEVFQQAQKLGKEKLGKESAVDYFHLGLVFRKLNDLSSAKQALTRAIEVDPGFVHAHYMLGLVLIAENNAAAALESFKRAAQLLPSEASIHYQLSRLYREADQRAPALQAIVETVRLDPHHTGALYQLYLYHQQQGDKEKADQIFQEFSRVKRALGQSRKELNADEGPLAKPISVASAALTLPVATDQNPALFRRRASFDLGQISDFAVADVNNDHLQDLIVIARNGEASVRLRDGKVGEYRKIAGPTITGAARLQLAKLVPAQPYGLLVSAESGLHLIPLLDAAATPRDPKQKVHNAKKTELAAISIGFGSPRRLGDGSREPVVVADLDHDGDNDLVSMSPAALFVNRGDGQFDTAAKGLLGEGVAKAGSLLGGSDLQNVNRLDLVQVDSSGARKILRDDLGGIYTPVSAAIPNLDVTPWFDIADMDNDGWTDIVTLTQSGLHLDFNNRHLSFTPKLYTAPELGVTAVVLDVNNDGLKDIVFAQKTGGLRTWLNDGKRGFILGSPILSEFHFRQLKRIDVNQDGRLDVASLDEGGQLHLLENESKTGSTNWLTVRLEGIRSAPDGRFTQVEVRYGSFYSKYEATDDFLHIPLGAAGHAEVLRITWPNGFVENKLHVTANTPWFFAESERISGSCPSIYAWNGDRFTYVTDAFISGPMGVPIGPNRYFPVGNDEYLKIAGDQLRKDPSGRLKVSIVEELREVTYLDQIKLIAVDSPVESQWYPNEHLLPPTFPEFRLHLTDSVRSPSAVDHQGNDVSALIAKQDYRYPINFKRLNYTGFVDRNSIELLLPSDVLHSPNLRLFLTGWFYYFDSTSLMAVAQQPEVPFIWPHLQVKRHGKWEFLSPIGIPSGKDKTVVVEVGGTIPPDAEALLISTNMEMYWDRILVDTDQPPSVNSATLYEMPLVTSDLRLHGFSKLIRPAGDFPLPDRFDYHDVSFESLWNPLQGKYTRYGDVLPLLGSADSRFSVFGAGDELAMTFDPSSLPPIPSGYRRDYLLYLNGYVKDGDRYTAHPGRVDPMPFQGMKNYPYSVEELERAGFDRTEHQLYLDEYQTRDPLIFTGSAP